MASSPGLHRISPPHGVVCLDVRVGIAQRPPVVRHGVGDATGTAHYLLHAAQLVVGLLLRNLDVAKAAQVAQVACGRSGRCRSS